MYPYFVGKVFLGQPEFYSSFSHSLAENVLDFSHAALACAAAEYYSTDDFYTDDRLHHDVQNAANKKFYRRRHSLLNTFRKLGGADHGKLVLS